MFSVFYEKHMSMAINIRPVSTRIYQTVFVPKKRFGTDKTVLSAPKRILQRQNSVINPSGHSPIDVLNSCIQKTSYD